MSAGLGVDVLRLLRPGKNVLGVMLGRGWLAPRGELDLRAIQGAQPRILITLLIPGTELQFRVIFHTFRFLCANLTRTDILRIYRR